MQENYDSLRQRGGGQQLTRVNIEEQMNKYMEGTLLICDATATTYRLSEIAIKNAIYDEEVKRHGIQ